MEPWLARLRAGDAQGAWDLFHERYHRLILATIRRLVADHDDVMDVYGGVCQALSADGCARLRRYSERAARGSGVATWLVAVVRNFTVDRLRSRYGRARRDVPSKLSPLQQEIFRALCLDGHSHVEAYELIRSRRAEPISFAAFLREVRTTSREAPCPDRLRTRRQDAPPPEDIAVLPPDPAESAESVRRLGRALEMLPPDVRLAVDLFVVEQLPAADVARVVDWPNAKAVYNRVSRALARIREELQREGIGPGDL